MYPKLSPMPYINIEKLVLIKILGQTFNAMEIKYNIEGNIERIKKWSFHKVTTTIQHLDYQIYENPPIFNIT